jgi:leader peptidase (prepilin peptidase) / N-methyltransferase
MEALYTTIFVILGAAVGSFLNVCVDRLPAGRSIIHRSSRCDACQRRLTPLEMIPVVSYLVLRGRCRSCRSPIPVRVLLIEILTAVLFGFVLWIVGLNIQLCVTLFYCCLFIIIAFIDLEHKLILNKVTYPAMLITLVISLLVPLPLFSVAFLGNITFFNDILHISSLLSSLLGGVIGSIILIIPALIFRGGMGWGDVKLAALIGFAVGFPYTIAAILIGIILGGLVAGSLLLSRIKRRKDAIPFGPFLSIAGITTILWGQDIMNWYMSFL